MKDDLISRQAALKELAAYIHLIDKTMGKGTLTDDDCMEAAKSVLGEDELPAAQPECKTGRWIFGFNNQYLEKYYYCSNCGCRKYTEDEPSDYFCSNCGADMRGR